MLQKTVKMDKRKIKKNVTAKYIYKRSNRFYSYGKGNPSPHLPEGKTTSVLFSILVIPVVSVITYNFTVAANVNYCCLFKFFITYAV